MGIQVAMSAAAGNGGSAELTPEQQQLYQATQEWMQLDGTRERSARRDSRADAAARERMVADRTRILLLLFSSRLKSHLKSLLRESDWQKPLTAHCQSLIYEKGLKNVTVDELVIATQQKAVEGVPAKTKTDMIKVGQQTAKSRGSFVRGALTHPTALFSLASCSTFETRW